MSVYSAKCIFRCFVKGILKSEQTAINCQQYKNVVPICQMLSNCLFFEQDPVRAEASSPSSWDFPTHRRSFFLLFSALVKFLHSLIATSQGLSWRNEGVHLPRGAYRNHILQVLWKTKHPPKKEQNQFKGGRKAGRIQAVVSTIRQLACWVSNIEATIKVTLAAAVSNRGAL